jgi:hypothetical protein
MSAFAKADANVLVWGLRSVFRFCAPGFDELSIGLE